MPKTYFFFLYLRGSTFEMEETHHFLHLKVQILDVERHVNPEDTVWKLKMTNGRQEEMSFYVNVL